MPGVRAQTLLGCAGDLRPYRSTEEADCQPPWGRAKGPCYLIDGNTGARGPTLSSTQRATLESPPRPLGSTPLGRQLARSVV